MNEPLYDAPLTLQHRKALAQGAFVMGLALVAMSIYLFVVGFEWPLGGRERAIDIIVMAIFGPEYANVGMAGFFAAAGSIIAFKGYKMWRRNA